MYVREANRGGTGIGRGMGRERAGFTSEVLPPYPKTTRSEWLSGTQMEWSSDVTPQQIDEMSQSESLLHNGEVEIY